MSNTKYPYQENKYYGLPKDLEEKMRRADKIIEESNKIKGMVPGKIFWTSVGDGHAYYRVVKVNKKTVRIEWCRDLGVDNYRDAVLDVGGTFPKSCIEPLIRRIDGLNELFGRK